MRSYICIVGNCSHARGWNSNGEPRNSDRLHRTKQQATQDMCTSWWSDTGEVSKYSRGTAAKETFVYCGAETSNKVSEQSVDKWNKCKEESRTKGCCDCNRAFHVGKSGSNEVCSLRICSQQQELPFNVKMFSKTLRLSPRIEWAFVPENGLLKNLLSYVLWSASLSDHFLAQGTISFLEGKNLSRGFAFPEIGETFSYAFEERSLVKKNLVDHAREMPLASAG